MRLRILHVLSLFQKFFFINVGISGVPDGFYILRNKVLPVNSDDICKKLDLICGLEFYIYSHFFTKKLALYITTNN